jgi:soluble lytic murein transglycosylase
LLPVIRLVVASVFTLALTAGAARADDAPETPTLAAIAAAHGNDWTKAYALAGQSKDPLVLKIVRWLDYARSGTGGGRFAEIAGFIDQNPDWPVQKTLRRRAEAAIGNASDDEAAAWLKRHPPLTGVGKVRAAEILTSSGKTEAGTAALRAAWAEGDFSAAQESAMLARFSATLRPEDHQKRLDLMIWDGQADAARRMLPLVSTDYRALAEARLALAADAANAGRLVAQVPTPLRSDAGLAFEEARWWRKKDRYDNAAQLLLAHSDNPVRPATWWSERLVVARRLLAGGNSATAYQLVHQQASIDDKDYSEAEFLCGYIALRFRKDPAQAFDHFAHILARVTSPYAKARAAYWGGRAAEADAKPDLAVKWYTVGAEHNVTFYGQLAAHQLGKDAPPHPVPEPRPSAAEQARFDAMELPRAAKLFFAIGDKQHARVFLMQMTESAKTPLEFAMLASLAEAQGRIDLAIAVARRSIDAGLPLMVHGYPVTKLPDGGTAERPLLLAIIRQESGFAPEAQSPVGARGLMQLMPGTAKLVASKLQLPFSLAQLTTDGVYNVMLGRSYIENMIEDFGGSYPLAIAAYNAGPGRVRQWLHDFGDPRGRDIGMVDWIEMIPFNETRAYVQRVMENLQIYRGQNTNNTAAFSLASDLAR